MKPMEQEAIEELQGYIDRMDTVTVRAAQTVISSLCEKQEREKGCEYCTTVDSATAYRRFYLNLFKGSDAVCIAQSIKRPNKFYLHVEMDDGGDGDCEISFCPHCGRKLVP